MRLLVKYAFCSAIGFVLISQSALAQPGRGGFAGGGMMGGFLNPSGLGLLGDEKVQKELDLDESQVTRVRELQEEMGLEMRDAFSNMRDRFREGNREEVMAEIREAASDIAKEFDEMMDKELLDHQRTRLKQLVYHAQTRRVDVASSGGLPESLASELGITEEQKAAMVEKAKTVKEDLDKKIANLRKQAEEEIMSVLTQEQRDKYKELMGEPFEFSQPRFGFGGPGRGEGGRGGRGGEGGGRREGRGRGEDGEGDKGDKGSGDNDRDF